MSEQWKGLHYHDRHVTAAPFGRTIVVCELGMACREVCSEAYQLSCGDWKKRALAAEAQVQAVREVCEAVSNATWSLPVENILRALDGDA